MNKPLHARLDFILSIATPILISIITGATIAYSEPALKLCFTAACYSGFVDIFKFPITIAALAFPLAGIVAAYHRSIETSKQINISETNNTFSNYIKHRDDFIEHLTQLEIQEEHKGRLSDPRILYKILFPENSYTFFDPSFHLGDENFLLKQIEEISNSLSRMHDTKDYSDESIFRILQLTVECSRNISHYPKENTATIIRFKEHQLLRMIHSPALPMQQIIELQAFRSRIRIFCNISPRLTIPNWVNEMMMRKFADFLSSYGHVQTIRWNPTGYFDSEQH